MGWQPIETAPRDGTVVDLWAEHRWANMNWDDGNWRHSFWSLGRPADARKIHRRSHIYPGLNPTHWKPLPDPPETTATPTEGDNIDSGVRHRGAPTS